MQLMAQQMDASLAKYMEGGIVGEEVNTALIGVEKYVEMELISIIMIVTMAI